MQQPANMSGAPATVYVQTASIQTRRRYIPVTGEPARQIKRHGVAHVVIGTLCIPLQLVSLGCAYWLSTISGNGIWIGTQFIVTGVFGIYAGRTGRKCQVITFHVLSTISAACALVLLCTAAMSAVSGFPDSNSYMYKYYIPLPQGIMATAIELLLAILAFAEGIVAIRSSVIGCMIGACCCKCGGSCCCPTDSQYQELHNTDEPDLGLTQQQSYASSQHEPTFNTRQEQPVLNQHQQQLMFNPSQQQPIFNQNQQQLMFNPNQQQPIFNPNQQQLMFNPNQQQPMFNPNQQQPIFNPNQQQPIFNQNPQQIMFLPTQPNVGFYPQHQAVQYVDLQPIIMAGSHQTDVSTIMSGAAGQGQNAGPLTELKTTPLPDENTGTSGGNGSDKGPLSTDDVEMLSP